MFILDQTEKSKMKEFGLTMFIALNAINLFWLWKKGEPPAPVIFISFLFLLFSFIKSGVLLKPLHKSWMALSLMMGKIASVLILSVIFYLIISPLKLALKLSGKDPLNLKFNKNDGADSYWLEKKQTQKPSYEKQS